MKHRSRLLVVSSAVLFGTLGLATVGAGVATGSTSATSQVNGTASPAATTPTSASVAGTTSISFDVSLSMRHAAGAQALAQAVSTPGSPEYRDYLTPAQWEASYSPTRSRVARVISWLSEQGLQVGSVAADRLLISVKGTASQIEQAFSTSLSYHVVNGRTVRLLDGNLSVPSSLAGIVNGAPGLSESVNTPDSTTGSVVNGAPTTVVSNDDTVPAATGDGPSPYPPPAAFVTAPPCGSYYNQTNEKTLPAYGHGYPAQPPYEVCGYSPAQLRSAYGVAGQVAAGRSGQGVTVAVVDAYASPTLLSDVREFYQHEDPANPLNDNQFSALYPSTYDHATLCQASGWYGEQTLDVTAVHAMAPGANILYVAGANCLDSGLLNALSTVIDGHLAQVVTDSWGDTGGDLLDSASVRAAYDNVLTMAAGTGVSVLFSSGDDGDDFSVLGVTSADYPPSSPYATAVGGTTLQIGSSGQRLGELGWSTERSYLCTAALFGTTDCSKSSKNTWLPLTFDGGSGGGTSYDYPQPWYQAGIVPSSLALENSPLTGPSPMRVEPDVAMDADPSTGMLVGETQTFPKGTSWATYRIGGTSVASPLFAGVVALADQASGTALGFLNPALYKLDTSDPSDIYDVVAGGKQSQARVDYANLLNSSAGLLYSTRLITYEGIETYCNGSGNCASRDNTLVTAPGYDNMTGLGSPGPGFVSALAKL
jgi:subtilase family serine protease